MPLRKHYDVVVVGRSLSAYMCAALLSRRRLRVRRIELGSDPDVVDHHEPIIGLNTAPIIRRACDELGLVHDLRSLSIGPPQPVTLALPDRRLTLPIEVDARGPALGALFPGHGADVVELFDHIEGYGQPLDNLLDGQLEVPPSGPLSRRAYRRAVADTPLAHLLDRSHRWTPAGPIRSLVACMMVVGGRPDASTPDAANVISAGAARMMWHLCHGAACLRDGYPGLLSLVGDKLKTFGGVDDTQDPLRDLEVQGRRVRVVRCASGTRLGVESVVFDGSDAQLGAVCERAVPEAPHERFHHARVDIRPGECPSRLRDPCGWLPSEGHPPCLVCARDEGLELQWWGSERGPTPMDALDRLVPFVSMKKGPVKAVEAPAAGQLDPLGLVRAPFRGPLRNVVRTGRSVVPGLGIEGDVLSAWRAAALCTGLVPGRKLSTDR